MSSSEVQFEQKISSPEGQQKQTEIKNNRKIDYRRNNIFDRIAFITTLAITAICVPQKAFGRPYPCDLETLIPKLSDQSMSDDRKKHLLSAISTLTDEDDEELEGLCRVVLKLIEMDKDTKELEQRKAKERIRLQQEELERQKNDAEVEESCDRGTRELDSAREKTEYIKLLDRCAENLIDNINPEKGLQYLLLKHSLQTGITDKQALLRKMAFNEHDVVFSVMALNNLGKYEEAADLLTFYFQQNPALIDKPIQQNDFFTIAKGLGLEHHAMSALSYFYDRKSDQSWQRRLDKLVQVAIPVGIVVGGIYTATQQQEQREAEERKKAEEEARREQAKHDAENARRRAQGLPTLEEEEQRRWQEQQVIRDRTRTRCLEGCDTSYHGCIGSSDPACCNKFCLVSCCPSVCSSNLAICRSDCD